MVDFSKYFVYDETSPSYLRWKVNRYSGRAYKVKHISVGDIAGSLVSMVGCKRYRVQSNGKNYIVSRVIWWLFNNSFVNNYVVDHIDGNTENNNISNLREVTKKVNGLNKRKNSRNTSGWNGVDFHVKYNDTLAYTYAVACIIDETGKSVQKTFSVKKFGLIPATRLAILKRKELEKSLVKYGIVYTERHGK